MGSCTSNRETRFLIAIMGILYIVPTPIGNLDDITLRAVKVLRDVSLIAAEDTRRAAILLSHFDLHTPVTSYFEHNKLSKLDRILAALEQGDVALISEAGTPGLSDPGQRIEIRAGRTVRTAAARPMANPGAGRGTDHGRVAVGVPR